LRVISQDSVTVALDTEITPELYREGMAREFVNRVQNMRKASDFQVTDRITISYYGSDLLQQAVTEHREYICAETLAVRVEVLTEPPENGQAWKVNDEDVLLLVSKERKADDD